jgi:hypothetical protein
MFLSAPTFDEAVGMTPQMPMLIPTPMQMPMPMPMPMPYTDFNNGKAKEAEASGCNAPQNPSAPSE